MKGYVSRVIQPGERLIYETRLHWLVYWQAVAFLILAVLVAIGAHYVGSGLEVVLLIVAGVLGLLAALLAIDALIRRRTTELAVTDQRIIYKSGVFSRHTLEMSRSKVESVDVDQTIAGRLLNYGTITVRGTGGSLEPIRHIGHPLAFRNHITAP